MEVAQDFSPARRGRNSASSSPSTCAIVGWLFAYEPYKHLKNSFNIYGVLRPSPERAMDEPRQGGIYNDYCITTVDNERSKAVFIHEFGHNFAGLADEYYTSDVAYNDFYPKGVEPLEPNITALLDPAHVKWADLVSPGISIPTDYGKDARDPLLAERQKIRQARMKALADARAGKASDADLKAIETKYAELDKPIAARLDALQKKYGWLEDKVGAFEGAGYAAKGLYRPAWYCIMISSPKDEFCPVCQRAIERMVQAYTAQ